MGTESNGFASFNDVLGKKDDEPITIEVAAWDGIKVLAKPLTARQRAKLEAKWSGKIAKSPGGFKLALLRATLINRDGTAWIPDGEDGDKLLDKSSVAIEQLVDAVMPMWAANQEEIDEIKETFDEAPQ